uniref:Uncharacterized protein n=1 Tax=Triticum urartu TaxID=4572 RepID=A0A8R7UPZ8_TRIUA
MFSIMDTNICRIAGSSMDFLMASCISTIEGRELVDGDWSIFWLFTTISSWLSATFCKDGGWKVGSSSTISSITTPFGSSSTTSSITNPFGRFRSAASSPSVSLRTSAMVSSSGEISWALLKSATAA